MPFTLEQKCHQGPAIRFSIFVIGSRRLYIPRESKEKNVNVIWAFRQTLNNDYTLKYLPLIVLTEGRGEGDDRGQNGCQWALPWAAVNQIFSHHRWLKTLPTRRPYYYIFLPEQLFIQQLTISCNIWMKSEWISPLPTAVSWEISPGLAYMAKDKGRWAPRRAPQDGCPGSGQPPPE